MAQDKNNRKPAWLRAAERYLEQHFGSENSIEDWMELEAGEQLFIIAHINLLQIQAFGAINGRVAQVLQGLSVIHDDQMEAATDIVELLGGRTPDDDDDEPAGRPIPKDRRDRQPPPDRRREDTDEDRQDEAAELLGLSVDQLRKLAGQMGVKGARKMRKADLVGELMHARRLANESQSQGQDQEPELMEGDEPPPGADEVFPHPVAE